MLNVNAQMIRTRGRKGIKLHPNFKGWKKHLCSEGKNKHLTSSKLDIHSKALSTRVFKSWIDERALNDLAVYVAFCRGAQLTFGICLPLFNVSLQPKL